MADGTEEGKIFVGGLSWETDEEFGEVTECLVMKNQMTGKSRGFGFVTFLDPLSVKKVLRVVNHQLDGRTIDPKECNPKTAAKTRNYKQASLSKIFLGGLPPNITETNLREFFSKYGKVNEAIIMFDQEKKKSRGFGFLSFDCEDAINKVVAEHFVIINGKQVEVKRAEPQHAKSGTPTPNGNLPPGSNMPMPFYMTPWPMWGAPGIMPPMNGLSPAGYAPNVWNHTTAAAAAAAIAATAAASTPQNWPYGYPSGWVPPGPYGQLPPGSFGQPSSGAGPNVPHPGAPHGPTAGSGPAGPASFMHQTPNNVAQINQNVPNGSTQSLPSGMMAAAMGNATMANYHEPNNYGTHRTNTGYGGGAGGYSGLNTHTGTGAPNAQMVAAAAVAAAAASIGNHWNPPGTFSAAGLPGGGNPASALPGNGGPPGPGQQQPQPVPAQPPPAVSAQQQPHQPDANSYNQPIQFHGSRIVSQNQGYHPYRRS